MYDSHYANTMCKLVGVESSDMSQCVINWLVVL